MRYSLLWCLHQKTQVLSRYEVSLLSSQHLHGTTLHVLYLVLVDLFFFESCIFENRLPCFQTGFTVSVVTVFSLK